jgi:hypothetical protein
MAEPPRPEPKFFLVDELYHLGLSYYSKKWFKNAPVDALCGEKSTSYIEHPSVAYRIARDLPDVKLVFMLRDPTERAISNYRFSRMNDMEIEDFETSLVLEESRLKEIAKELRYTRPNAYFSRGLYAEMLEPYFALFARDQLLVLKFEDVIESPRDVAVRLHQFLGVSPRSADVDGLGVVNASPALETDVSGELRAQLNERYEAANERLAEMLGPKFRWK